MDTTDIDTLAQAILNDNKDANRRASLIRGIEENQAHGFLTIAVNTYVLNKAYTTGQAVLIMDLTAVIKQLISKLKQHLEIT